MISYQYNILFILGIAAIFTTFHVFKNTWVKNKYHPFVKYYLTVLYLLCWSCILYIIFKNM